MRRNLESLARERLAYVESDGTGFPRAARILQALWRERHGFPMGKHNGHPLGSRLAIDFAERELANYLTPGIRRLVQQELASASDGRLFAKPRIYDDLLSSQPLCFNLFGELKLDLSLATQLFDALRPGSIRAVTDVRFEYSPKRSSERFTGDRSAFDVFVEYETPSNGRGFFGIEVKFHETLKERAAAHRSRYDEVAEVMGCFVPTLLPRLHEAPLQQFWRDHLLAGSMVSDNDLGYSEGVFVIVYPAANTACRSAVQDYRRCLRSDSTFDAWTLDEILGVLGMAAPDAWVEELRDRYLGFSKLTVS